MTDNTELKRLAEAATPGPWYQHGGIMQVLSHDCETVCETFEDDRECPDAQFIAAANPAAVLALIAENDHLAMCARQWEEAAMQWGAERDQLRAEVAGLKTGYEAYERVNAELKAENEALREEVALDDKIIADRDQPAEYVRLSCARAVHPLRHGADRGAAQGCGAVSGYP